MTINRNNLSDLAIQQDMAAEALLFWRVRGEVYRAMGERWGRYAAILILVGTDEDIVEDICFDGYMTSREHGFALKLTEAFAGFCYPGSGKVVSTDEAAILASEAIRPPSDRESAFMDALEMFRSDVLAQREVLQKE